ncbi:MAG: hypothetical protein IJ507_09425 [Clostridia bacterium]|nr:hypothetical protein [Clostridia bacterium]
MARLLILTLPVILPTALVLLIRAARPRPVRRVLLLMRRILRFPSHWSAVTLLREEQRLLTLLLCAQRKTRRRKYPPALTEAARELMEQGSPCDAPALIHALEEAGQHAAVDHAVRSRFPDCVRLCAAEYLLDALSSLLQELRDGRRGEALARRLVRARRPGQMLRRTRFTPALAHALNDALRRQEATDHLALMDEHLLAAGLSAAELSARHAHAQSRHAEIIVHCMNALRSLKDLHWEEVSEAADPLHLCLMKDPAGVYPRMTPASRSAYRRRCAWLARLLHTEEERLGRQIIQLCQLPEKDGLADHAGWYLLEAEGMQALRRSMNIHRGAPALWALRHGPLLRRAARGLLITAAAYLLLLAGHSLWLLPPLLMLITPVLRLMTARLFALPEIVPEIDQQHIPQDQRTLLVMPVVLRNRSDALPAVRRLLLASRSMPEGRADCLLLCDFDESPTASSAGDSAVIHAVKRGVEAINTAQGDCRFLYLHRSRVREMRSGVYAGRGGLSGAAETVRQLLSEGSCPDEFAAATVEPSSLRRRYVFMLLCPAEVTPSPGLLPSLTGALSHPLNRRRAALAEPSWAADPDSLRTYLGLFASIEPSALPLRLLIPDAVQEPLMEDAPLQVMESVCGCVRCADALAFIAQPQALTLRMRQEHRYARLLWQGISWLLPWRSAPTGVERSPLDREGRRRCRLMLTRTLLPGVQLLTLIYAAMCSDTLLLAAALLLPELPELIESGPAALVYRLAFLPLRASARADAIFRALWQKCTGRASSDPAPDAFSAMENWSQTLAALALGTAALLPSPPCWAALLPAVLFAFFPLLHVWLDRLLVPGRRPGAAMETSLMEIAHATWRGFEELTASHPLPPESLQSRPWRGAADIIRPDDAGLYLLSCLAALQLELISAEEAAGRMLRAMDALERLPLWNGLPYAGYGAADLTPLTDRVDTQRSGMLCACLLCAAQGMRNLLQELPESFASLPVRMDAFARAMELERLYDASARLFRFGMDTATDTPDPRLHRLLAHPALLTGFSAVMLGQIPASHLDALDRTRVRTQFGSPLLSPEGSAADYLLPALLLHMPPASQMRRTLRSVIRLQRRHGVQGMFGTAECAVWLFDSRMKFRVLPFGLAELSLHPGATGRVIAPYAAALTLPFEPQAAHDSLMRLRSHGMLSQTGLCDGYDLDPDRLPQGRSAEAVQCHVTAHQAAVLCALCNALTDGSLIRTFSAIPAAASTLLLLHRRRPRGLILPGIPAADTPPQPREPSFRRHSAADELPLDAHIIGSPEASLALSVRGTGVMRSHGVNVTRFTGNPCWEEGLQFYLEEDGSRLRLGEGSQAVFAEGSIRLNGRWQGLEYTLSAMTESAGGSFLHTLEIVNLAPSERFLTVCDCLIPGFDGQETEHPSDRMQLLRRTDGIPLTLCHVLTTADPLIALSPFNGDESAPVHLGFRMKLSLGARGRACLVFTTRLSLSDQPPPLEGMTPRSTELPGLLTLSRLACRAVYDTLGLSQAQAALISRCAGVMLWQGQPHQGAVSPLRMGMEALAAAGLEADRPLMTLLLYTSAGLPLLEESLSALGWICLSGQAAQLCIMVMGSDADAAARAAEAACAASPAKDHIRVIRTAALPDGAREAIEAASRLLLYEGAGDLAAQLDALRTPLSHPPVPARAQAPALPPESLLFPARWGGVQEQTGDFVLRLSPGEAAPRWRSPLCEGSLAYLSAAGQPGDILLDDMPLIYALQLWLCKDEMVFSPFDPAFSRRVQFSPGQTVWYAAGHELELTLTAACLPDSAFVLHTLRLKSLSARSMELSVTVTADFGALACLTPVPGGVFALRPDVSGEMMLIIPDTAPSFRRMSPARFMGAGPLPSGLQDPGCEVGSTALLSLTLTLDPSGGASVSYLAGMSDSAEAADALCRSLITSGASPMLRLAQQKWASRLGIINLSSPSVSTNLLFNRLLAVPLHLPSAARSIHAVSALMLTDPIRAREILTDCLALADSPHPGERLMLPIAAADYFAALGEPPPEAVHAACMRALTSIRLSHRGLPLSEGGEFPRLSAPAHTESILLGMIFACALDKYAQVCGGEDQADILEVRGRLLSSLMHRGWHSGRFLAPSPETDALTQCWAALALGRQERTVQALQTVNPAGSALPLITRVRHVEALCALGQYDQAWDALDSLNPLPEPPPGREPWLLARKDPDGACALLYSIMLRRLLGAELQSGMLKPEPHLPQNWDSFSLTLQLGTSTWHVHAGRDEDALTLDGKTMPEGLIPLADDGRIHQLRLPAP